MVRGECFGKKVYKGNKAFRQKEMELISKKIELFWSRPLGEYEWFRRFLEKFNKKDYYYSEIGLLHIFYAFGNDSGDFKYSK